MQTKTVNTLISLFESIVFEDSTVLPVFKGNAEAEQLILALHKANKLSHNAEVVKSKELTPKQLLSLFQRLTDSGTTHMLILLKGPKAVAVTVSKSDDKFMQLDKGRLKSKGLMSGYWNYQERLKQTLQNVIGLSGLEVYMIKQPGTYVTSVRRKRAKLKPGAEVNVFKSPADFANSLVKKFKPLWLRTMEAARADVKGYVNLQIKNGAYDLVEPKLRRLKELDDAITDLEFNPTAQTVELVARAITDAIAMSAYHYYPEKAGRISREYNRAAGRYTLTTGKNAVEQLFNDISTGDMTKLGTILAFFKRNLIDTRE
jgi:predicted transcriptional regulator